VARGLADFRDRVAVITGASSGIGEQLARDLAARGAHVALLARRLDRLEALANELGRTGITAIPIACDVSERASVDAAMAKVVAALGHVDLLVNNAGFVTHALFKDHDVADIERMVQTNLLGTIYTIKAVLPSMRARKQGWIVNISSGASRHPKPTYKPSAGNTVYGMVKAALERFTTGLSCEVYDDGIAVNVISPGLVETPGVAANGFLSEKARARLQPITYIAEAVLALSCCDPATMSGRIDHAAPFLEEFNLTPAELI